MDKALAKPEHGDGASHTAGNATPIRSSEIPTRPTLEAMIKFAAEYTRREVWSTVYGYAGLIRQMIGNMPIRDRHNTTLIQSEQDASEALQAIVDGHPERATDLARLLTSPPLHHRATSGTCRSTKTRHVCVPQLRLAQPNTITIRAPVSHRHPMIHKMSSQVRHSAPASRRYHHTFRSSRS